MRFGSFYFFQLPPGRSAEQVIHEELDEIVWAEELGFDRIWFTEHHFIEYGLSIDPAMLAAATAMRTERVRIGLAAAILPFHDPIRLAEQLAMVDIMSNGRLDVGVGRGNRPSEFAGYRIPQIESRERFEEVLAIMVKAWSEERFSFEGKFYRIPEVRVLPKPQQKPHPPLYMVCVGEDTIVKTAQRGIPMLNSVLNGPTDVLIRNRDLYLKTLKADGRSAAEIAALMANWGVSRQVYVARTDAQALEEAREAEMWYQQALRRFLVPDDISKAHPTLQPAFRAIDEKLSKVTWEALVRETLMFGSPDTVSRKVQEMVDMGVGEMMCWMNFGGLGYEKVRRSMELFSREVMPNFRQAGSIGS
jgi:alkanesulfonate monooxygenase SsuD/methylene tetrahydromethanopterin reductase-like flavin-dependent oxidoreductase (luciferase family)